MPDYLHPISDEDSSYTIPPSLGPPTSGPRPAITTRGQLSYGAILEANKPSSSHMVVPYHSTTLTTPEDIERFKERDASNADTLLSPRNMLAKDDVTDNGSVDGAAANEYGELEGQDDYEKPVSTNTSLKYAPINHPPPSTLAPAVPTPAQTSDSIPQANAKHIKMGLKVLPSNPLALPKKLDSSDTEGNDSPASPKYLTASNYYSPMNTLSGNQANANVNTAPTSGQPTPRPRNRKDSRDVDAPSNPAPAVAQKPAPPAKDNIFKFSNTASPNVPGVNKNLGNTEMAANRDSLMSDTSVRSSHHYYVLEPNQDKSDYENSVSSPKLV